MRIVLILAAAMTLVTSAAFAKDTAQSADCKPTTLFQAFGLEESHCSASNTAGSGTNSTSGKTGGALHAGKALVLAAAEKEDNHDSSSEHASSQSSEHSDSTHESESSSDDHGSNSGSSGQSNHSGGDDESDD